MTEAGASIAALRQEFDEAFARPISHEEERQEDLLLLRAGGRDVALRAGEIALVLRCPPLTRVPGPNPALAGLVGVRSALTAVYSLSALLGESQGLTRGDWLVVCAADRSAAFLFDELAGYARVPATAIHAGDVGEVVQVGGGNRTLVRIAGLLEAVGASQATV